MYERLPRVSAYVAALPDGLASYPEAQAKASTIHELGRQVPRGFPLEQIPPDLRELLLSPPPVSSWISETQACALSLALRDVGFDDDASYLAWIETGFTKFFSSSLYRILMTVASPHTMAKGAAKRWAALRRGTSRSLVEAHDNGNISRVDYPAYLVPRLHAEATARGILVAYRMSRAKDPRVTVVEHGPTHYVTKVIYDAALGDLDG